LQNSNFTQQKEFFSLNALKCLRNEYLFNDCTLCFERCEHNALGIFKEKIKLFDEQCTQCGECIGICPTQALSLETFDVNEFVFTFLQQEKNTIVHKIDIPTFGMLDAYNLISIVLRAKKNIFLHYYEEDLALDTLDYIDAVVCLSNEFLVKIGVEHSLFLKQKQADVQNTHRRGLFKTLINTKKELQKEFTLTQKLNEHDKAMPVKQMLFKNSLKLVCEDIRTQISTQNRLVFNKQIDFNACTNCVECVTFCPTQALFQNASKDAIYFQSGKCIGCDICEDVCKHGAIEQNDDLDMIGYMFDKAQKLVEFEYITCKECNNSFIKKDDSGVCGFCKTFLQEHSNMFTLAKDV
jgi:ferredoxin